MKKKVWIFHHYATPPNQTGMVRPFDFGKGLIKEGYDTTVFSSAFLHYLGEDLLQNSSACYLKDSSSGVPFVYLRTHPYIGNGFSRVQNMFSFFRHLFSITKTIEKEIGTPDVIIASSPHPLTCIAGIYIARRYKIPCIVEIRDLWPESIVAYSSIKKTSLLAKILYQGEKWIYKKADKLIFTIEGGQQYIKERGWEKSIDSSKIFHLNNGVDLEQFTENIHTHQIADADLLNPDYFNVVYTGSVRHANGLELFLEVAKLLQKTDPFIRFLIYGDGSERQKLQQQVDTLGLTNLIFKGRVPKNTIPYILSCSDLNLLHYRPSSIWKYGGSQNKLFEYFASGKPVLADICMGYDLISRYHAGISIEHSSPSEIAQTIHNFAALPKSEYESFCQGALNAAKDYDFSVLTKQLIQIIEGEQPHENMYSSRCTTAVH